MSFVNLRAFNTRTMTTLRKSIYIGIGGAGIKAVAHTKKMFEDEFGVGKIPQGIQFIAIDSDYEVHGNLATNVYENFLLVGGNVNVQLYYDALKNNGQPAWMFPENEKYIHGAGQVRTNGRLLIELEIERVRSLVLRTYNQVAAANDAVYGPCACRVDVHIACSLAGGTGSGAFIPLSCIIRNIFGDNVNIYGYGLMHGIYRNMCPMGPAMLRVASNTYAAVLDLDYFQSASPTAPAHIAVAGKEISLRSPLFDRYYLMDNVSEKGFVVGNVDDLCQMMAGAMYMYGAECAGAIESDMATTDWRRRDDLHDVYNKRGWVHRLGFSEVVYDGESLAKLYALKAKQELIRQIQDPAADMKDAAVEWAKDNKICDRNANLLIDRIFSSQDFLRLPNVNLSTKDSEPIVRTKVDAYLADPHFFISQPTVQKLYRDLGTALREKTEVLLLGQKGIATSHDFLAVMKDIVAQTIYETEEKLRQFNSHVEQEYVYLEKECKDYASCPLLLSLFSQRKQAHLGKIALIAKRILEYKIDEIRHIEFIGILKSLICDVECLISRVDHAGKIVAEVRCKCEEDISRILISSVCSPFVYDLSFEERFKMTISESDVSLADFMTRMSTLLHDLGPAELDDALGAYCSTLPRCDEYRSKLLIDVINGLSNEECKRIGAVIERKSECWLELDSRFMMNLLSKRPISDPVKTCIEVDIYAPDVSVLWNIVQSITKPTSLTCSTSHTLRQKMMVCRLDAAVIPYCVSALNETVEMEYERSIVNGYNPHIDAEIFADMKKKGFKLKPEPEGVGSEFIVVNESGETSAT